MIPQKVIEHLEEYISQEIYVQIAIIKGKEKVSNDLAINKYFKTNHFRDLSEGRPFAIAHLLQNRTSPKWLKADYRHSVL